MLDPRLVAENPEQVREALRRRGSDAAVIASVDRIVALTERRAAVAHEGDEARAVRNKLSPQIGALMKQGRRDEAAALRRQVQEAKARAEALDTERRALEAERRTLLLALPNLLDERVPPGDGEGDNVELRRWAPGEILAEGRAHDELGVALGIMDFEAAARISGSRFTVLRGAGARLERALISWFLDLHTSRHGYTELVVPYLVWASTLEGTAQLPKFEEDLFKLSAPMNGQDAYLIPTAEVPVTNLHRGEILAAEDLPRSYVCFTPCFRSEAGAYGRDTRGYIRQHQFHKVELVKITTPEDADAEHEALTGHAEACLEALGLPYRVMRLCGGDIGFGARHCYDLEVWLPSQGRYREISSCSSYGDFQARRMNLRYRPAGPGTPKPRYCHTINGSGLAVGRTLVAILENYQQPDGSVRIPEVLRPYMGGLDHIAPPQ